MSETYNLVDATMKIIQDRRSIRNFTDEPVSEQDLDMLMEAARQGLSEVVTLLLSRGVNFHAANHAGQTAMDLALEEGHFSVADILKRFET